MKEDAAGGTLWESSVSLHLSDECEQRERERKTEGNVDQKQIVNEQKARNRSLMNKRQVDQATEKNNTETRLKKQKDTADLTSRGQRWWMQTDDEERVGKDKKQEEEAHQKNKNKTKRAKQRRVNTKTS